MEAVLRLGEAEDSFDGKMWTQDLIGGIDNYLTGKLKWNTGVILRMGKSAHIRYYRTDDKHGDLVVISYFPARMNNGREFVYDVSYNDAGIFQGCAKEGMNIWENKWSRTNVSEFYSKILDAVKSKATKKGIN